MKQALIASCILVGMAVEAMSQSYTTRLEQIRMDSVLGIHELNNVIQANVFADGVLVPPEPSWTYAWWRRHPNIPGSEFYLWGNTVGVDTFDAGHTYLNMEDPMWGRLGYYCIINGIYVTDTITVPWWRTTVDQTLPDGARFGYIRYWKENKFTARHEVPDTFYTPQETQGIILQADTNLSVSRSEKYYRFFFSAVTVSRTGLRTVTEQEPMLFSAVTVSRTDLRTVTEQEQMVATDGGHFPSRRSQSAGCRDGQVTIPTPSLNQHILLSRSVRTPAHLP